MGLIASRNFTNLMRLPQTNYMNLIVVIIQGVIVDLLFWQVKGDKAGVQNRQGAIFFIALGAGFGGVNQVIHTFP